MRRYLVSNGYLIEYEHMLCDEGKYYFIFHVLVKKMKESGQRKSIVTEKISVRTI